MFGNVLDVPIRPIALRLRGSIASSSIYCERPKLPVSFVETLRAWKLKFLLLESFKLAFITPSYFCDGDSSPELFLDIDGLSSLNFNVLFVFFLDVLEARLSF